MSEKKTFSNLSGFLLLDKEKGVSSHKALYPIKKFLPKGVKIGHTGTLDPEAEGLLVVAIGRATKFIPELEKGVKEYRAGFEFGYSSDTLDVWGDVSKMPTHALDQKDLELALKSFEGEISQVPPMYSALKKDGKPLYKLARKGIEVERKPRFVTVYSISLNEYNYPKGVFTVTCSKGTYVRTLISDIATTLGESAVMTYLRRTKSDFFDVANSVSIDSIKDLSDIEKKLIPIEDCFSYLDKIYVDEAHMVHIKNGVKVDLRRFSKLKKRDGKFAVYCDNQFIGVAQYTDEKILMTKKI